ncbi:cysteine-rich small domain-containing protein [uncultured Allofournierella sp.]|uniref:cysteine-rich small domain-containing protein n=1 Tax=uncultured Allofournierella sp. TaxID=1940258 RepID=UPI003753BF74
MKQNDHTFFENRECRYFPCHKTQQEDFNCLFCYCPLYALGEQCDGKFAYTESGIKDCSNCLIPHSAGGYDYILSKFPAIAALAKRQTPHE